MFRFQGWSDVSQRYKKLFAVYSVLPLLPMLYLIEANIRSTFSADTFNPRLIGATSGFVLVVLNSVYLTVRRNSVQSLLDDFRAVTKFLTEDDVLNTRSEHIIFKNSAKLNTFFKYLMLFYISLPASLFFEVYVKRIISKSTVTLFPVPCDSRSCPVFYEITLLVQYAVCLVSSLRLIAAMGFIFAMLYHSNLCLKQLKLTSKCIFLNDNRKKRRCCKRIVTIKQWLRIGRLYNTNGVSVKRHCCNHVARFKVWIKAHKNVLR